MPLDQLDFVIPSELPASVEEDEVCRVLRRAAHVIRERGWCQNIQCDDNGRVCISGAFYTAVTGDPYSIDHTPAVTEAARCLYRHLGFRLDDEGRPINSRDHIHWNNKKGRTQADVIAALEGAADRRAQRLMRGG